MNEDETEISRDGPIIQVALNRPEQMNALTPRMYIELARAWHRFEDDPDLRVAIVTGMGHRAFTAGADLKLTVPLLTGARAPRSEVEQAFMDDLSIMNTALLRDLHLVKPVIAAINGDAVGAGMEMVLATDVRIASSSARLGLPEVRRGIIPGGGSITRLPRQVPWAVAAEIMMSGELISASRALEIGLVNEVVEPEAVLHRAREVADRIAANAPLAVRAIKDGMHAGSGAPLEVSLRHERRLVAEVMETRDAREGALAFAEKRAPHFEGR